MERKHLFGLDLKKTPRFLSFDAGVVAGLLSIGIYMAISNRHWFAAALMFLGMLWMAFIPIRSRWLAKSNASDKR